MIVDLKNNWKVPNEIIELIPDSYLIKKVIEIIYLNHGKISDLIKSEYMKNINK